MTLLVKSRKAVDLADQLDFDQKRYSRYVCDSRAIPNVIDGLKPVQRRVLWTMWNSRARDHFTKTVKIAGMVMAYHPHGNTSIEDAIAQMAQDFPFANNYPLVLGEGTFGDVLDPKAIASPRYTEVRLSDFAKDLGLFESLEDIEYVTNYDETEKEPIFFIPKIPLVLLNPILGIATGFKCLMPPRHLKVVCKELIRAIEWDTSKKKKFETTIEPWVKGYNGRTEWTFNDQGGRVFVTGFGFKQKKGKFFLTDVPHNWSREKTVLYLEQLIKESGGVLRDYEDHSRSDFDIELIFKRGERVGEKKLADLFVKETRDIIDQNVITSTGRLQNRSDGEIIAEFLMVRRAHLKKRFERLQRIEEEKMEKESELIRFIREKWNERIVRVKNRETLKQELQKAKFVHLEWLVGLSIYRLTQAEVARAEHEIKRAGEQVRQYKKLKEQKRALADFMKQEIDALVKRWG